MRTSLVSAYGPSVVTTSPPLPPVTRTVVAVRSGRAPHRRADAAAAPRRTRCTRRSCRPARARPVDVRGVDEGCVLGHGAPRVVPGPVAGFTLGTNGDGQKDSAGDTISASDPRGPIRPTRPDPTDEECGLMSDAIKAAVLVAPGRYEVQEFPRPTLPDGALLMQVEMSGICGTDKHTWQGWTSSTAAAGAPHIRFPLIQGHENVGRILALGGPVTDFEGQPVREGDRVMVSPNVSCGTCWACTHLLPYTLCERTEDYGNTLSAADPPHLLGGWAEAMSCSRLPPVPRCRTTCPTSRGDGRADGASRWAWTGRAPGASCRPSRSLVATRSWSTAPGRWDCATSSRRGCWAPADHRHRPVARAARLRARAGRGRDARRARDHRRGAGLRGCAS